MLRDILKEVQGNMVPRSMLKEWALHTFPNATDYWTFRKMFTIQLALIGLAEFMLHLNRLNPEMLQIAQVGHCGAIWERLTGPSCRDDQGASSPYLGLRDAFRAQSTPPWCVQGPIYTSVVCSGTDRHLRGAFKASFSPRDAFRDLQNTSCSSQPDVVPTDGSIQSLLASLTCVSACVSVCSAPQFPSDPGALRWQTAQLQQNL